jgi:mono/diheme cytochrome c family protein
MKWLAWLTPLVVIGLATAAQAQETGDPAAGAAYAKKVCTPCHAVLANEQLSPLLQAPTFQAAADTPGMTATALTVWLQSSHPTMPNIVLAPNDRDNVIAYILSLKRKP